MVVSANFRSILENIVQNKEPTSFTLPVSKETYLKIFYEHSDDTTPVRNGVQPVLPFAETDIFDAPIISWRRLSAKKGDCKAVYEVDFDIKGSGIEFKPGDTIGILPQNNDGEVNFLVRHLGVHSIENIRYSLSIENGRKGKIPQHIPVDSTIRHVLTYSVDIRGLIKKMFLLQLSTFTKNELERRILEYLCSKEGSRDYTIYVIEKRLTVNDIFHLFPSCQPPIEVLFEHLPRLLPRPYSIANSPLTNPNVIRICFSVITIDIGRKGLTTGWLEDIILNDINTKMNSLNLDDTKQDAIRIPLYLRKNVNSFSLPELEKPIILIGPGTGVSPFIGFLQEHFKTDLTGSAWLFFGCRNSELDHIYKDELNHFLETGALNQLCLAYSRSDDSKFKYVQDAIHGNGEDVVKLIKDGAYIYLAGDVQKMVTQVKDVLIECIALHDKCSLEEAKIYLKNLEIQKRYLVDVWN